MSVALLLLIWHLLLSSLPFCALFFPILCLVSYTFTNNQDVPGTVQRVEWTLIPKSVLRAAVTATPWQCHFLLLILSVLGGLFLVLL